MRSSSRKQCDQSMIEPVRECRNNGYLLSSKKIGSGAFSKVYLGYATHEKLMQNYKLASDLRTKQHSMVAIKIIATGQAPPEYYRKFLPREIYSLNATYKHVNVIQLYESFRNERRSYLVLELASRGDLLEYINITSRRRELPGLEEDDARRLFRQIISAVAHCHNHSIVHRDLKCENILLDDRGFVKLTDFGFASRYSIRNSMMSTFCGSVAYTAPEILMTKKYNGELSDLWSLGVILYAMVTGKLPFRERHPCKMVCLIKQGLIFKYPISKECKDLIRNLLQWKPNCRLGLQQVATHCWMLPTNPTIFEKILTSVGSLVDQRAGKEQQQKKGKKIASNLQLSLKESRPQIPEALTSAANSKQASCLSTSALLETGRKRDLAQKSSALSIQCHVQLLSPAHPEDRPCKSALPVRKFFLCHSGTGASPKPSCNLPNIQKPGCSCLSKSHNTIKTLGDKVLARPVVSTEQNGQFISFFPIGVIGKNLAQPLSMDSDH